MKHALLIVCSYALLLMSCTPKVSTHITQKRPPLDYKQEVIVFELEEPIPDGAADLGTIRIGDSGFTTQCEWDQVIEEAKLAARKIGGNALKITKHKQPSLASTCHRISATVLYLDNPETFAKISVSENLLDTKDYALLHIYRSGGVGPLVSYDLHLDDTVLCRVTNKFKTTIKIRRYGPQTLWAKTEAKDELAIHIEPGHEYYIRCSVTMGAFVGHPHLANPGPQHGETEFEGMIVPKSKRYDVISMTNGKEIKCIINREDEKNIYCTVIRNNKRVDTQVAKSDVKEIRHEN